VENTIQQGLGNLTERLYTAAHRQAVEFGGSQEDTIYFEAAEEIENLVAALRFTRKLYQSVLEQETASSTVAWAAINAVVDHIELHRDDPIARQLLEVFRPHAEMMTA
jgi:hypothetical protein